MSVKSLPWESVTGSKYYAQELKPRKKWMTACCWAMSILFIVVGVALSYYVVSLFGALYILTLMMQKDTVITTRGVEIFYQMHITTHYDFWGWDQVASVTREDRGHPELVALHISNGDRSKRLFFTKENAKQVMELARKQNPKIIVGDADKSQMIGLSKKKR